MFKKYPSPWEILCKGMEKRVHVSPCEEEHTLYVDKKIHSSEHQIDKKPESDVTDQELGSLEQQVKEKYEAQTPNTTDLEVANPSKEQVEDEVELHVTYALENKETDITKARITQDQEEQFQGQDKSLLPEEQVSATSENIPTVMQSTMDRVTRNMIFSLSTSASVENLQEQPETEGSSNSRSKEGDVNRKNTDVWVPPSNRDSQLRLVKENYLFDIRAYRPETSPTKLFSDDGEEEETRRYSHEFTPEKVKKLEGERREIIKKQAQRKSLDIEEVEVFQDAVDAPLNTSDTNGLDSSPYKKDVDTEQINFEAARQQFVMLEKKKNNVPISPRIQPRTSRLSSRFLQENNWISENKSEDILKLEHRNELNQNKSPVMQEGNLTQLRKQFFSQLSVDDVDSGVEEKPHNISKHELPQEASQESEKIPNSSDLSQEASQEPEKIPSSSNETPIEREIRLGQEREESLRKERGIQSVSETQEMVEILKNTKLPIPHQTQTQKNFKDRARSSFYLQREIEKEAQREAVLKSEGKAVGFYDKGNAQELDERRKLFEQLDEVPVIPQQGIQKTIIKATINEDNADEKITPTETRDFTENWAALGAPNPYRARTNWKPVSLNNYRSRRQSAENILDIKTPSQTLSTAPNTYRPRSQSSEDVLDIKASLESSSQSEKKDSADTQILSKDCFQFQPWKGHFHVNGDEELDGSQQRMDKYKVDAEPTEMYKVSRLRPSLSSVIEQDIKQTLERDRELQEQRRKSEVPSMSKDTQFNSPVNGCNQYGRSYQNSGDSSKWSPSAWKATPFNFTTSYPVSPVQMFMPKKYPKFVASETDSEGLKRREKEENWYAGIEPSDDVNTEIVESTRVNRHKNRMALRWEAGLYSNEQSD